MIFEAWRDGFSRVLRAPSVVAGVLVMTFVTALPLATTLRGALQDHLGSSLMADQAADAVNYDWWQEFTSQAGSIGTTFTPSIIGFATTLDSITSLLDGRTLIAPIAWAVGLYLAAWVWLWGGILDRLARAHRVGAHGFFAASGAFFARFLRLAIVAGLVYWFLFAYVHEWLFDKWYDNITRDISVEPTVFMWRLLMYAIYGGLLAFTTTLFDYAKVRAVVEDRRSMLWTVLAALRFLTHNPLRVAGVYAVNAIAWLIVVAAWAWLAPGAGGMGKSLWVGVVLTQCYVLARLIVKLTFVASATALFQRTLAHAGFVASPAAVRAQPPIVEAIGAIPSRSDPTSALDPRIVE